jgi:class 3 adenylate cyclase/CheY-like chemotaxis protein
MTGERGHILVVDDYPTNRLKLSLGLKQQGHTVAQAESGRQALDMLFAESFDLVLLDILMPEMDGYEVLRQMKSHGTLRNVPVIVISAQDELESIVHGIELGAEDYLPKSFDPVLLKARIEACLEKKRLRDQEQDFVREIQKEREKSERLLLNILPFAVAERLKQTEDIIADNVEDVSVMFVDIVDFVPLSTSMQAADMVKMLNTIFSTFDALVDQYGLEKIKTSGDSYMVVGGLPLLRASHLEDIAGMALDVLISASQFSRQDGKPFQLRLGIHCGPVVAGVIGTKKFAYDLWGETVNIASRMESQGMPNTIQVTQQVYERLQDCFLFQPRGEITVKGKGNMMTYLLTGRV